MATTTSPGAAPETGPTPVRRIKRQGPAILRFYSTAVGKKWVMGLTGLALMGFVAFHLFGNLKLFLSKEEFNLYGEALRDIGGHLVPRTFILWVARIGLIGAFFFHIHAAATLTIQNRKARPDTYKSKRDYIAADFASRSMRWTGVIVLLFLLFHLADLTWGKTDDDFLRGDPYNNLIASFERPGVAAIYVLANIALAIHLYHGAWSMFQSMGINNPKYNTLRRTFAQAFAAVILVGNLSFPIAVQLGLVEQACPQTDPVAHCDEESGLTS